MRPGFLKGMPYFCLLSLSVGMVHKLVHKVGHMMGHVVDNMVGHTSVLE